MIKEIIRQKKPFLGICLGAQLLAKAVGARVYPGDKLEIGWHPIRLDDWFFKRNPLFFQIDPTKPQTVFHWHGDTFDLPPGAVRLATSARYLNQGFRLGPHAYGFQFHFEVNAEMIAAWVERGAAYVREGGLETEPILAGRATQLESLLARGRKLVEAFADLIAVCECAAAG